MTPERVTLDELDHLEKEATPGPWEVEADPSGCDPGRIEYIHARGEQIVKTDNGIYGPSLADAELITAARNMLPDLIKIARAAQELRKACPPWSPEAFTKLHDLYAVMRAAGIEAP